MAWYKDWFDSPLYDKLYAHRDDAEAGTLADLILSKAPPSKYPRLLDLACGRGRHSFNLSKRGYTVLGTDLSQEALRIAREKAEDKNADITFRRQDMREPLPETFDIIVNLFTSFGYFEDDAENISVFKSVKQMLRPGGLFVFDYLNAAYAQQNLVEEESGSVENIKYHIERWVENGTIFKKMSFSNPEGESASFTERVKLYPKSWFISNFKTLNFKLTEQFGHYDGRPFDPEKSERLILFLKKV